MSTSGLDICVIPARLGSSRFPNKPLKMIAGMPMIGHVALRCSMDSTFNKVVVATCDQEIVDYCQSIGIETVMTSTRHERATDRIQEGVEIIEKQLKLRFETVTMVQGDEPLVSSTMLRMSLKGIKESQAHVTNLMGRIHDLEEWLSPNCVKVVTDRFGFAHYFTRSPIPYNHSSRQDMPRAFKQICVIGFKRDFLDTYVKLEPSYHEIVESIDMNRVLDHGYPLALMETSDESYPVDVPSDIDRVEKILKECQMFAKYGAEKTQ